jgi:hypothetical protein
VDEGRLAYRLRTAEAADDAALRGAIGATLAHPDPGGRRESYRGAASRGDILVLEHYDRQARDWQVAGFVECHMRVDDQLSIRDIGTAGSEPQTGVVRYLLDAAFNSFRPLGAQVKIRRDARDWLEIVRSIPGFHVEGEEYRRPHYWTIWLWDQQRASEEQQAPRGGIEQQRRGPRPPTPPRPAGAGGPRDGPLQAGNRPGGPPKRWSGERGQAGSGEGPRLNARPSKPPARSGGLGPRGGGGGGGGGGRWPGGGPRPSGSRPSGPRPGGPRPNGPRPGGPRSNAPRPNGPGSTAPRPNVPRPGGPRPPGGPGGGGPRPDGAGGAAGGPRPGSPGQPEPTDAHEAP